LNDILTSSVDGAHEPLLIVHLKIYVTPAVPVKVLVELVGAVIVPPVPPTILQDPVPTVGVLAARVAVVNPHIAAPV
jgi:hypothetical protein